ncbi:myosin-IIIb-like isoform X1 [Varroa jacobsoni]|uniref:myosin-IIIb-like isoform X1 n=1 Tax=Varroa jacobsoni TaxID=62625 RepID=UPI000BF59A1B|nr:myosin-IIIb-like isoform X1 [Varroa jacobsoni]
MDDYPMTRLLPDQLYTDELLDGYKTDVPIVAKKKPRHGLMAGMSIRAVSDVEVQSSLNQRHQRKAKKRVVRLADVKAMHDYHSNGAHFNNLSQLRDPLERSVTLDLIDAPNRRELGKPQLNVKSHNNIQPHPMWTTEHTSMIDLVDLGRESGSPLRHNCFSEGDGAEIRNFGFILGPGFVQRKKLTTTKSKALPLLAQIVKPLMHPLSKSSTDLRAPSSIGSVSKWAEILHNNQIIFCGAATNFGCKTLLNDERRDASPARKSNVIRAATDINLETIPSRPPAKPPRFRSSQSLAASNRTNNLNSCTSDRQASDIGRHKESFIKFGYPSGQNGQAQGRRTPPRENQRNKDESPVSKHPVKLSPLALASSMEGVEIRTLAYFGRTVAPPTLCDHQKRVSGLTHRGMADGRLPTSRARANSELPHVTSGSLRRKKKPRPDASSQNEAAHYQQRLKSISSELVTLRKRVSVALPEDNSPPPPFPLNSNNNNPLHTNKNLYNESNNHRINHIGNHGSAAPSATCTYENIVYRQCVLKPLTSSLKPLAPVAGDPPSPPRTHKEVHDLIHTNGPLTEDSVLRTLHERFHDGIYFTSIGPVLLAVNPYHEPKNDLTLTSVGGTNCPELLKVVKRAVRQQRETGCSQTIFLSGESGSGKTFASMVLLRQLFNVAGGGPETDSFKHLAAAFTVLRSLGTAKTTSNSQSSRIGYFIEVQATDGVLYRTKIRGFMLDQSRVVRQSLNEKNYHIFYQLLAGLSPEDKEKLHLKNHSVTTLNYLNRADTQCDTQLDAERFRNWRSSLALLGFQPMDVLRVLAAVLLLGNIQFVDKHDSVDQVDVEDGNIIKSVALLLGTSSPALHSALTRRTTILRGKATLTACDLATAVSNRDALAKALYCRTVEMVLRKANSLKGAGSTSGTLSSDSNESVHQQHLDVSNVQHGSLHQSSTLNSTGSKSHKSMSVLNSAVKQANDGFIGIFDMFGFENNSTENRLEQLCINLCAETMQNFYNLHVFKSSLDACTEEGVNCDFDMEYANNMPCIDLISHLRTGIMSMCNVECSVHGSPDSFVENLTARHKNNPIFFRPSTPHEAMSTTKFVVRHYVGNVTYDAAEFLDCNRDEIVDDLLCLFHKNSCTFPFVSNLFGAEMKILYSHNNMASGAKFRICSPSPSAWTNFDENRAEPISTITQDFLTRVDKLWRKLISAKPHFIRCIKSNDHGQPRQTERTCVMKQLRVLQVLETVNLMACGYAHRMRFREFNNRYYLLAPFKLLKRKEETIFLDSQEILEHFTAALQNVKLSNAVVSWTRGKKHIFLSEHARQLLERFRDQRRYSAALLIQTAYRSYVHDKKERKRHQQHQQQTIMQNRTKPIPKARGSTECSKSMVNGGCTSAFDAVSGHHSWTGSLRRQPNPNTTARFGAVSQASRYLNTSQTTISRSLNQSIAGCHPSNLSVTGRNNVNLDMSMRSCFTQLPSHQPQQLITSARTATLTKTGTVSKLSGGRPRPQPIAGTPPPETGDQRCDPRVVLQTCAMYGLDSDCPPPIPPSRSYTVTGNAKLSYPQERVMRIDYPDNPNDGHRSGAKILKGDTVMVLGSSTHKGHLRVECRGHVFHVPHQLLELRPKIPQVQPVNIRSRHHHQPSGPNSLINATLVSN